MLAELSLGLPGTDEMFFLPSLPASLLSGDYVEIVFFCLSVCVLDDWDMRWPLGGNMECW